MYTYSMPNNTQLTFRIKNDDLPLKHTHNGFWDFMIVTSGTIIHKINGTVQKISRNALCIVRPDDVHMIVNEKGKRSSHINMGVSSSYLKTFLDYLFPGTYETLHSFSQPLVIHLTPMRTDEFIRYSNDILLCGVNKEKSAYDQSMHLMFLMFLQETLRAQIKISQRRPEYGEAVSLLVGLMDDASNLTLNAEALIRRSNYSYSHMNRLFLKETGTTLNSYLTTKKLEYAKSLLIHTSMPLCDVGAAIGFDNPAHFSVFFKKHTGECPSKFVKQFNDRHN